MSRKKYDETFKRQIIHEYETGGISCYALGQKYGVDAKCVRSWCRLYKQFGEDYFTNKNKYSYKALEQNKKCNLNNMFRDDKVIVYVIEKKDDDSIESRVVRKLDDEKNNS